MGVEWSYREHNSTAVEDEGNGPILAPLGPLHVSSAFLVPPALALTTSILHDCPISAAPDPLHVPCPQYLVPHCYAPLFPLTPTQWRFLFQI